MKIFNTIILILSLSLFTLNASEKEVKNIANMSAAALYNIDKNSLQKTMDGYVQSHPELKAVKIVEVLSGETYYQMYKKDGDIFMNKEFPKITKEYIKFTSQVKYDQEVVGEVIAYYKNNSLIKLSAQEENWIRNNPTIAIAVVDNYPPYDFRSKTNELIGFHSDIAKKINEKLGINIVLKAFRSWEKAYNAAKSGKVNGIFSLSWSKERADNYFNYTSPYHFTPYYLIVNKDDDKTITLEALSNQKIAIQRDTIFSQIVKEKVSEASIVYVEDTKDTYISIQNGESVATISPNLDEVPIEKFGLKMASEIYHESSNLHIGVNKQYPLVNSILDKGIKSVPLQELAALRNKWFKKDDSIVKLTSKELAWLQKHPEIILGADQNWQPFDFKDRFGKHAGFNADYLQLIREKLGIDINVELGQWGELQQKVKDKKIAGLVGPSKTETREKYMVFTQPYFNLSQVILVRNNASSLASLDELNGKTLALKSGSSQKEYISKNYPKIKQKIYETYAQVVQAVSLGEVDAALSNIGAASYEMKRNFIANIKVGFSITDINSDLHFGIRKDWPELVSILQKGMDAITTEENNKILTKWLKLASASVEKITRCFL